MRFQFSNVVVVDDDQIGVIVKSWADNTHDVYVRAYNGVKEYHEDDISHYVYSKELLDEQVEFY
ncbi:MAG: hypothetical protein OQK29_01455 [Ignavibacteriaceae bacterium]|nr:hypothetical protein [Ignavibacteriaceae bacterium]